MARLFLVVVLFGSLVLAGCSTMERTFSSDSSSEESSPSQESASDQEVNYYYDYDDVLIPSTLSYKADESYNHETPRFKAGVMRFSGNTNYLELVQFFQANMVRDNWSMVYKNQAKTSTLVFEKSNKISIIRISDSTFGSSVEIFVSEQKRTGSMGQSTLAN